MAWTTTIGQKFTHNEYLPIIASAIARRDHFLGMIDTTITSKPGIHFLREATDVADEMGWVGCEDTTKLTMDPTEISVALEYFHLSTELCVFSNQYDTYNDQVLAQIQSLARKAGRNLGNQLINGAGGGKPKGLRAWVSAGQTIALNGALTFEALDNLIAQIQVGAENLVLVTNTQLADKVRQLARANGFALPDVTLPNGQNAISFRGYPIIETSWVHKAEIGGTASSIYAVSLDTTEGFHMVMGEPNAKLGSQELMAGELGPFQFLKTPVLTGSAKHGVNMYSRINLVLKSERLAARLSGITY